MFPKDYKIIITAVILTAIVLLGGGGAIGYQYGYDKGKVADSVIVHDTIFTEKIVKEIVEVEAENIPDDRPLPYNTRYKVGDKVCAWERWTGIVIDIQWSDKNPELVVYEVQHWNDEEGWTSNQYYEQELNPGGC
jgi:hypothetical protein